MSVIVNFIDLSCVTIRFYRSNILEVEIMKYINKIHEMRHRPSMNLEYSF